MATGAQIGDIVRGQSIYRLEELIAVGGLAEVWKAAVLSGPAKDVKKLETVALKFPIEPHLETNLREEANTLDHLWRELPKVMPESSVALVEVIEHGASANNGYFIAMRYYDRTSLNRFYPEPQRIPTDMMANVMQAIAPTLDAAHSLQPPVMHRDIKLGNVLLDSSGEIVLADFLPDGYGNVRYAAPEVVRAVVTGQGWEAVDARADIYSLGVMLYRALTGHYPIEIDLGDEKQELRQAYNLLIEKNVPVPVPADISEALYGVLERALQRGLRYRYTSCLEMANDFVTKRNVRRTISTPEARPTGAFEKGSAVPRLPTSLLSIFVVAAVCLAVLGILLVTELPLLPLAPTSILAQVRSSPWWFRFGLGVVGLLAMCGLSSLFLGVKRLGARRQVIGKKSQLKTAVDLCESIPGKKIDEPRTPTSPVSVKVREMTPTVARRVVPLPDWMAEGSGTAQRPLPSVAGGKIPLARLKVIACGVEKDYPISGQTEVAIISGKTGIDGIVIEEREIFQKHLTIRATDKGFLVEPDISSALKIWIADVGRLEGPYLLQDGDIIVIGKAVVFFSWLGARTVENLRRAIGSSTEPKLLAVRSDYHLFSLDTSMAVADTGLPQELPIFVFGAEVVGEDHIDDLRETLVALDKRIALLIQFAEPDKIERSQRLLDSKLQGAHAYDVVAVSFEGTTTLGKMADSQAQGVLRGWLLSKIDLTAVSPYVIRGAVPDNMFFGREHELRQIVEHIGVSSYALVGGRRIGKTSTLLRLHSSRLPAAGYRSLYYDCSVHSTCEAFLKAEIKPFYWSSEPQPRGLRTFGDLLESAPDDLPLVLLLDEIEKLVLDDQRHGWSLFNKLRSLSSSHRLQIVMAGSTDLDEAISNPDGPLFNFAAPIPLGKLEFAEVEALVVRPMNNLGIWFKSKSDDMQEAPGKKGDPAIVRHIYTVTGGHPNLVQYLCHRLVERLSNQRRRDLTLEDVVAVASDSGFLRDELIGTLWGRATSLEKLTSLVMVQRPDCRSLNAALAALKDVGAKARAGEVDGALKRLVRHRLILTSIPGGYEFAIPDSVFLEAVGGAALLPDQIAHWLNENARERRSQL